MPTPTSTKQYVINGLDNTPTPITVTINSVNGASNLIFNALKLGRNILGISVQGSVQNGSSSSANSPYSLSGKYSRIGGNNLSRLNLSAEVVANAFGYDFNSAYYTNIRALNLSNTASSYFYDIEFSAESGAMFQCINPFNSSPVSNPYELDSIYIESASTVDELILVDCVKSGTGSTLSLFCKKKGNKYYDFFVGSGSTYNQYNLDQDNGGNIVGSKICSILGITPISADTHAGSGNCCWFTNTSGTINVNTVAGTMLDAIYV